MPPAFKCRSSASISPTTLSLSAATIRMPKCSAMPARGSPGIRGGGRKQPDDLFRDQLVARGGEVNALIRAQPPRPADAGLSISDGSGPPLRDHPPLTPAIAHP